MWCRHLVQRHVAAEIFDTAPRVESPHQSKDKIMALYRCAEGFGDKVICLCCGSDKVKMLKTYITIIGEVLDEFVIRTTFEYVCDKCNGEFIVHYGWFDIDTKRKKKKIVKR